MANTTEEKIHEVAQRIAMDMRQGGTSRPIEQAPFHHVGNVGRTLAIRAIVLDVISQQTQDANRRFHAFG